MLPLFSFATGNKPHFLLVPPVVMYFADRAAGRYHINVGPIFTATPPGARRPAMTRACSRCSSSAATEQTDPSAAAVLSAHSEPGLSA